MSFRLYDYENNGNGNSANTHNNNNIADMLAEALAARAQATSGGMEAPPPRGVAASRSAGGEESSSLASMRAALNMPSEEELLLRSRLLAQAQAHSQAGSLLGSTGATSDNGALQALLRMRANQQGSTAGLSGGLTGGNCGFGASSSAAAGLFGAGGGPSNAAATNTNDLELLYRWRASQMLQQQQQHPPLSNTNDLIEQALQLRNNQATTEAGRRLSLLLQAGGSGRALGGGSGRLSSQEDAATALLRRSLVERAPSNSISSAAAVNVHSADLDIASLVRSSAGATHPDLAAVLQRNFSGSHPSAAAAAAYCQPAAMGRPSGDTNRAAAINVDNLMDQKPKAAGSNKTTTILQLPPVEEGNTVHHSQRVVVPLGIEEDPNWLSERQCFIRSDLLEVVRASHEEVLVRSSSKSISYQQVGIRCRYCAHLTPGSRAIRASAFPSSIRQMYQSFTMMVRDHFGNCAGVPVEKKQHFLKLKGLTSPSSSLSRQYWTFAAQKLGMMDSEYGIMINEESQAAAADIPPFGTSPQETLSIQAAPFQPLVEESDRPGISSYLFFLLQQAQIVHLLPSERVGKRKDAAVGLSGFGCRHCAEAGRLGFCRMFPLNKRSLPDKVNDLYNHMVRCPLCPRMTKRLLESRQGEAETDRAFAERDRDFIDRIWIKLGRDCDDAFKKS